MSAASAGTGVPESGGPFSRRALWWIIGVSSLSLLVGLAYLVFGDSEPQSSSGANSFSRSALGHRGFVELQRRNILSELSHADQLNRRGCQ